MFITNDLRIGYAFAMPVLHSVEHVSYICRLSLNDNRHLLNRAHFFRKI